MPELKSALAPKPADAKDVFNHALSHHVTHWAAYVAMMGILLTIAFVLSITPVPEFAKTLRKAGIGLVIASTLAGALYFSKGMDTYGALLHERLPLEYIGKSTTLPHKAMIAAAAAAALILAALDYTLLVSL